jgi:hypothetical protein
LIREGHGYRVEDGPLGPEVVATGGWTPEAAQALEDSGVTGLALSPSAGFAEPDLEFLQCWPLRRLVVLDRRQVDLSPVERLAGSLQQLLVDAAPGARLDLTMFGSLSKLEADWDHVKETIASAGDLRELILWPFEGERDLHSLVGNLHLTHVTLKEATALESLEGVQELSELQKLAVLRAPFLEDITALGEVESPLVDLEFEESMGIEGLDDIRGLSGLNWFGISNSGSIESLAPLESLQDLETFHAWGTTRVTDNDLSPLQRLPKLKELRMRDRRGYSPKVSDIQEMLANRREESP